MSVEALSKYVFSSKYARWIKAKKRREHWETEAVDRQLNCMLEKYRHQKEIHDDIKWAYDLVREKWLTGSQRFTQFAGPRVFKHAMTCYNCSSVLVNNLRVFQELMYVALCGTGAGFSVQKKYIEQLPKFSSVYLNHSPFIEGVTFVIPDNIIGWADAAGVLISSLFDKCVPGFEEYHNKYVEFDYSKIREKGAPLDDSNGFAPGPEPLKKALDKVRSLIFSLIRDGQDRLRPIDVFDIICILADAVLSGGVRRMSLICLFSLEDELMMKAKTGDWFYTHPWRARANISAVLRRDNTTFEQFRNIITNTRQFGEPGFFWVDDDDGQTTNPCAEISLFNINHDGNTGWQVCNLCSINGAKIKTKEEFYNSCRAAAILGTLQAGFDEFPYLGKTTNEIIKREALLGVSLCGIMDSPEILLDPEIQQEGAEIVIKTNEEFAAKIGINPGSRCTTVKPDGTVSLFFGSSSGIHPRYSRRYFRRVQANPVEPIYKHFKKINPLACQPSSNSKGDEVITFCVEVNNASKYKSDVSAIELLEAVKLTKENWIEYGTNHKQLVRPYLRHNISNTVSVKDHEWDDVIEFIYNNRNIFSGITLMSASGDKDYDQAPFTAVYSPEEIVDYFNINIDDVHDYIDAIGYDVSIPLWEICDMALGIIPARAEFQDKYSKFFADITEFSSLYFNDNIKKATYFIKDCWNWNYWKLLKEHYKDVDYSMCVEDVDNTNYEQDSACIGGRCDLVKI